jgi:hypothetical protein
MLLQQIVATRDKMAARSLLRLFQNNCIFESCDTARTLSFESHGKAALVRFLREVRISSHTAQTRRDADPVSIANSGGKYDVSKTPVEQEPQISRPQWRQWCCRLKAPNSDTQLIHAKRPCAHSWGLVIADNRRRFEYSSRTISNGRTVDA